MWTEIRLALRPALSLLMLMTLVTGLAYPLAVTGAAQVLFPAQANGSLLRRDGHVIGSTLIGQNFATAGYFHGRPSAAGSNGYDASASGGSNFGPGSAALVQRIDAAVADLRKNGISGPIPADLVTTSGSGLDPDISPAAALVQAPRVARARGLPVERVQELVAGQVRDGPLSEQRVNVLELNLALDRISGKTGG